MDVRSHYERRRYDSVGILAVTAVGGKQRLVVLLAGFCWIAH